MFNPIYLKQLFMDAIQFKISRTGVRVVYGLLLALVAYMALGPAYFAGNNQETEEVQVDAEVAPRTVSLYTISANAGTAVRTADGSAFIVRSQSSGRVDRVAKVGDTLVAGATVAQIENSAQRAALIQAEGSYDAAVAAAGGNQTSQTTARQDAVRTWNTETVSVAQVMYNSIDTYFSFSQNNSATGFRVLDSLGAATEFNQRRLGIEELLKSWRQSASTITEDNAADRLNSLENDLSVIARFIDDLAALVPRQSISDKYTDEQRIADTARIAAARASVTESQRKIDVARTAIVNSSGSNAAISNAQVKQALGALESARASLGKTIIKTPVAGTVTAVSISVGDIINVGSDVVFVAGDTAMTEATVTVPLTAVKFTPTKAFIFTVEEGVLVAHEVETGLVTNTTIAISGAEGISDVVADIRGLKDGDAVVIN